MKTLSILSVLCALSAPLFAADEPPKPLLAFPGAQGYAAFTTGGRGGEVYHVTNLQDSGTGSFREAVSAPKRTIVFDVGGVIRIKKPVAVKSDITIAGETAPGEGVTIFGEGVSFSGSHNIIVRYVRFRQGIAGSRGGKSLTVTEGGNMIFDHVSILWGRWDSLGFTKNATNITLQNSIIGESLDPQRFGGLIDGARGITLARNLWINNQSRNPKIKGDIEYINNVVYNWGVSGVPGGHSAGVWHQDVINNLFIAGPSTTGSALAMFASTDWVFQQGNEVDITPDGKLDTQPITPADFHGETPPTFQDTPFSKAPVSTSTLRPLQILALIIKGAGASLHRDAVETRLIEQLKSLGTKGAIIHSEVEVGGQPEVPSVSRPEGYDSDRDGLPDSWELAHKLDPKDVSDANKLTVDGYTNLESFLHSLCG